MNKLLARRLFNNAHQLYRGKNYAAALELLDRLDAAFPHSHRIVYPRAMCLAEVGRVDDALALCDELLDRHKYKRAKGLRTRIVAYAKVIAPPAEDTRRAADRRRWDVHHPRIPLAVASPAGEKPRHARLSRFMWVLLLTLLAAAVANYSLQNGIPGAAQTGAPHAAVNAALLQE